VASLAAELLQQGPQLSLSAAMQPKEAPLPPGTRPGQQDSKQKRGP